MSYSYSPFQEVILAELSSKKTWNSDILKKKVKWEYAKNKQSIPVNELQGEIAILAVFVEGFVAFLLKSNFQYVNAKSVVVMYEQAIADSKPFVLGE